MKLLKKLIALLCSLALVLSLAPCAFADVTPDANGDVTVKENEHETMVGENTVGGNLAVEEGGSLAVTPGSEEYGIINSTAEVTGSLTNAGTIQAGGAETSTSGLKYSAITSKGPLTNSGQIIVSGAGAIVESGDYETASDLTNKEDGSITVNGSSSAHVIAYGDLTNEEKCTITVTSKDESRVAVWGDMDNSGNITISENTDTNNVTRTSDIDVAGTFTNSGNITVNSGESAALGADSVENHGSITLTGETVVLAQNGDSNANTALKNDTNYISEDADFIVNYGTITVDAADLDKTFYGVQYLNDDGTKTSLLKNWLDGEAGKTLTLDLDQVTETRDGYTFGGWQVGTQVYQPGSHEYKIFEMANITKIWNKILAAVTPANDNFGSAKSEKAAEQIAEFVEGLKVLDADRNELAQDIDYYRVARTTHGRLIVLFTDVQLKELPSGENLFYIITPDGAEVEYTLQIA